jgi:hypothetical protein
MLTTVSLLPLQLWSAEQNNLFIVIAGTRRRACSHACTNPSIIVVSSMLCEVMLARVLPSTYALKSGGFPMLGCTKAAAVKNALWTMTIMTFDIGAVRYGIAATDFLFGNKPVECSLGRSYGPV